MGLALNRPRRRVCNLTLARCALRRLKRRRCGPRPCRGPWVDRRRSRPRDWQIGGLSFARCALDLGGRQRVRRGIPRGRPRRWPNRFSRRRLAARAVLRTLVRNGPRAGRIVQGRPRLTGSRRAPGDLIRRCFRPGRPRQRQIAARCPGRIALNRGTRRRAGVTRRRRGNRRFSRWPLLKGQTCARGRGSERGRRSIFGRLRSGGSTRGLALNDRRRPGCLALGRGIDGACRRFLPRNDGRTRKPGWRLNNALRSRGRRC
mgnify:CR=1 FL=1